MAEYEPSPEHSFQSHPDILQEALAAGNFDNWLTRLPEDRLRYLYDVTQQFEGEQTKDEPTLVRLVALSMLFSGKEGLRVPEVMETFEAFVRHLLVEIDVREGNIAKVGTYSMVPEEETALLTLTEKGRQMYRAEQKQ